MRRRSQSDIGFGFGFGWKTPVRIRSSPTEPDSGADLGRFLAQTPSEVITRVNLCESQSYRKFGATYAISKKKITPGRLPF